MLKNNSKKLIIQLIIIQNLVKTNNITRNEEKEKE